MMFECEQTSVFACCVAAESVHLAVKLHCAGNCSRYRRQKAAWEIIDSSSLAQTSCAKANAFTLSSWALNIDIIGWWWGGGGRAQLSRAKRIGQIGYRRNERSAYPHTFSTSPHQDSSTILAVLLWIQTRTRCSHAPIKGAVRGNVRISKWSHFGRPLLMSNLEIPVADHW